MGDEKIIKTILNQTIGSTHVDSQGEKIPKRILEDLCKSGRIPIQQEHQPDRRPIGYFKNIRLVRCDEKSEEWVLIGDAYYTAEPDTPTKKWGMSWSAVELIEKYRSKDALYAVYLPYPFYNNEELLGFLEKLDEKLSLGRWYKKTAHPSQISLLVSFVLFFLSPGYSKFFNNVLWPKINKILRNIPELKVKGIIRTDFVQLVDINGHRVNVYFVPQINNEEICFERTKILNAFDLIYDFVLKDNRAGEPGYNTIKLHWDQYKQEYFIDNMEYRDGSVGIKGVHF